MINARQIEFTLPANGPNIARNPLPNHNTPEIGAIFLGEDEAEDFIVAGITQGTGPTKIIIRGPVVALSTLIPPPVAIVTNSVHSTKGTACGNYEANIPVAANLTRSGRVYTPEHPTRKDKGNGIENPEDTNIPTTGRRRQVTEEDLKNFYEIVRRSEYDVVEQLKRAPARISIMSLLQTSEIHRKILLDILSDAHVPADIEEDKFKNVVGAVLASNHLTFTDEELTEEGRGHVEALHIEVQCKGVKVPRVLVDNGSTINVIPRHILNWLPIDHSHIKPHLFPVRAFDGTSRMVEGKITLPIMIGPTTFEIEFHVMDIHPSFNMLIGRPWIHMAGAIPSTLHQMVKFVSGGSIVTVHGEHVMARHRNVIVPFIGNEAPYDVSDFHTLEFVNATYAGTESGEPKRSAAVEESACYMLSRFYIPGGGLGKNLQGRFDPVILEHAKFGFGLGFKPDGKDIKRSKEKKRAYRLARFRGGIPHESPITYFPGMQPFVRPSGNPYLDPLDLLMGSSTFHHGEYSGNPPNEVFEEEFGISKLFDKDEDSVKVVGSMREISICAITDKPGPPRFPYPSLGQPLNNWNFEIRSEQAPRK